MIRVNAATCVALVANKSPRGYFAESLGKRYPMCQKSFTAAIKQPVAVIAYLAGP